MIIIESKRKKPATILKKYLDAILVLVHHSAHKSNSGPAAVSPELFLTN